MLCVYYVMRVWSKHVWLWMVIREGREDSTGHGWAHMDILPCFVVLVLSHEGKKSLDCLLVRGMLRPLRVTNFGRYFFFSSKVFVVLHEEVFPSFVFD